MYKFLRVLITAVSLFGASQLSNAQTDGADQASAPAPAPCTSDAHRAFDFWLGEWKVTNPDGSHAGDNTITAIQGGCVLREDWRSGSSAFTGTSYNFYNTADKRWEQIWLDNQGGHLHLMGERVANKMILRSAKQLNAEGVEVQNQITWTRHEDGSVQQEWRVMSPGREDQIAFDGLYRKAD